MIHRLHRFVLLLSMLGLLVAQHGAWLHAVGHAAETALAGGTVAGAAEAARGGEEPAGSGAGHTCVLCIAFGALDGLAAGTPLPAVAPSAAPLLPLVAGTLLLPLFRAVFRSRAPPALSIP